jgi:hypothetical protein
MSFNIHQAPQFRSIENFILFYPLFQNFQVLFPNDFEKVGHSLIGASFDIIKFATCVVKNTLGEAPMAYKSLDEIVRHIGPAVLITGRILHVFNFKAADK